jgi:hypothetical protein
VKKIDKIWRLIPSLLLGLFLNYKLINNADNEFVFDFIVVGILLIVLLITLLWTINKDTKEYRQTKSKQSFIPTSVGLFVIMTLIGTDYFLKLRDSSPLLIQAGYDGGFNGAWYDFRKDGTYKFGNHSGIGATYIRGAYILKDSLIILDKPNVDIGILTNTLVFRNGSLYHINDRHEIVDKEFVLNVYEDNR